MVEFYYNCQSDNGSITEESALRQWSNQYLSALDDKKDPRAPLQLGTHLANAGFTSVESQMIPLPISGWSNGEQSNDLSLISLYQAKEEIYRVCLIKY